MLISMVWLWFFSRYNIFLGHISIVNSIYFIRVFEAYFSSSIYQKAKFSAIIRLFVVLSGCFNLVLLIKLVVNLLQQRPVFKIAAKYQENLLAPIFSSPNIHSLYLPLYQCKLVHFAYLIHLIFKLIGNIDPLFVKFIVGYLIVVRNMSIDRKSISMFLFKRRF